MGKTKKEGIFLVDAGRFLTEHPFRTKGDKSDMEQGKRTKIGADFWLKNQKSPAAEMARRMKYQKEGESA